MTCLWNMFLSSPEETCRQTSFKNVRIVYVFISNKNKGAWGCLIKPCYVSNKVILEIGVTSSAIFC